MNEFLFDLGNTRLKWSSVDSLSEIEALAHHGYAGIQLPANVRGEVAWVASVAPDPIRAALLDTLTQRFMRVHFAHTQQRCGDLRIAYPDPRQLGVDRFLSLLGSVPVAQATLIVSVGTALTIDALLPSGQHLGGVIAASPNLMRAALFDVSAKLASTGGDAVTFADNTLDALASGTQASATALIENRRRALEAELGEPVRCVMHGGGAEALHARLPEATREQNLVLRGLNVWRDQLLTPRMAG